MSKQMSNRFKWLGIVIVVFGLAFVAAGGYAFLKVQDGSRALNAFSAAQDVSLSYNEQGQLTDHGTTDGAATIMNLLTVDWGYSVNPADFNPTDPIVNTASEYMYQMAAITEHTLSSTVSVTLPADVTAADGTVYKAGTYDFAVDGRYYSQFDRTNPIEAAARGIAWSGTPLALIGQLGVGAATYSSLQMGLGLAGVFTALGGVLMITGLGFVWATRPERENVPVLRPAALPA